MAESKQSGRTRDQYAAVVGKKVRAIEKKLKRISTIETNAASSGVNDQQAGLLAKKPQLLSSLQDYRALLESFKTITAKLAKEEAEAAEAAEAAAAQAAAAAEAAAAEAAQAAAAAAEAEAAKLVESGVSTTPAEAPAVEEGKSTNDIVREAVLVAENSNEAVYLLNNVASHVHTSAFAEEPLGAAIVAFSKIVSGLPTEDCADFTSCLVRAKNAVVSYVSDSTKEAVPGFSYFDLRRGVAAVAGALVAPAAPAAAAEEESAADAVNFEVDDAEVGATVVQGDEDEDFGGINFFAADDDAPAAAAPAPASEAAPAATAVAADATVAPPPPPAQARRPQSGDAVAAAGAHSAARKIQAQQSQGSRNGGRNGGRGRRGGRGVNGGGRRAGKRDNSKQGGNWSSQRSPERQRRVTRTRSNRSNGGAAGSQARASGGAAN